MNLANDIRNLRHVCVPLKGQISEKGFFSIRDETTFVHPTRQDRGAPLFKLSVPQRKTPFELIGEVVWSTAEGEEAGMGIKFVYSDDSQRTDFESVVETLMTDSLGADLAGRLLNKPMKT